MRHRSLASIVVCLASLAIAAGSAGALAQVAPPEPDLENLHFAFANYAGSGIYSVEGRTVQVYHFPYTFDLRDPRQHAWGLSLRLPPTVGIYDLQPEDAAIASLVNRVATLGFVPRLNVIRRLSERWTLTPFVDFGAAKNLDGGDLVWVYGIGVVAEAVYPMDDCDLMPLVRFVSAHHTGKVGVFGNDLVKLEPGLEARFPLGFRLKGNDANLGVFGKHYSYFNELEIVDPEDLPFDFTGQWEFGITLGTRTPLRVLGVHVPRMGVSFRFGDNLTAFRFVFGNPL